MRHEIPMPGDAVRLDGIYCGARTGAIGVIEGMIGSAQDHYSVVFSPSAFRPSEGHGAVSASGGPVPRVGIDDLVPTGETARVRFWRFRNGEVRAHNAEDYWLEVPLWSWVPRQFRAQVDEALDTARYWESLNAPHIIDAVRARAFLAAL